MAFGAQLSVVSLLWSALFATAFAGDVLRTHGFTTCLESSDIEVKKLDISFDRTSNKINFDIVGSSKKSQKIKASLVVNAYGQSFTKDFDPCDKKTKVDKLCPVPAREFVAKDELELPDEVISKIPSIAFAIPDLEAEATLKLKSKDGDDDLACIKSTVNNGKTLQTPAVSYAAVGIAGAALVLTGISALSAGGTPGVASSGPSFGDVVGWFHSMATNGMLSVNYPPVYRSFTKNFAFSGGLLPWTQMQTSIDSFRNVTGGNLTTDSVEFLKNATLVFSDQSSSKSKRSLDNALSFSRLVARDSDSDNSGVNHIVKGIQGYVEQLSIPKSNTFMTVLLIFAIVIAAIAAGILLLKVILEVWALRGSFPAALTDFRKHYWGLLARTITNLILILYGIWTLYCVFQFTRGDSWAAKVLAAVTLAIFTAILAFFTWRIWSLARKFKKSDGDATALYEDRETWRKYSLFYDAYKQGYWWLFVPLIAYMFIKGCIIAGADGHGLIQSGGQLIVEAVLLVLLLWARPYETKSSQWIHISIQVVRVLSVACIIVFVQELGMSQTTKTVTGVALVAVQSTLTGILAILIAVNAIIMLCRKNPHLKRQEDREKAGRDLDNLTPLDARNSLLMETRENERREDLGKLNNTSLYEPYRDIPLKKSHHTPSESTDRLVTNAPLPGRNRRNVSQDSDGPSLYSDHRDQHVGRAY